MTTPSSPTLGKPFNRLLLTGAAGGLGQILREALQAHANVVRASDISAMAPAAGAHEEVISCNLADKAGVLALAQGVDAIVHLGGISTERAFEEILDANIRGTFHIYEAARKHGIPRVVFASSNHVTGFYPQDEQVDAQSVRRPDCYYGLSKSYGEDLATFYFHRYGIETVSLRIGSSFPEPTDRRHLITWLSYRDCRQLVEKSLSAERVGFMVAYGMSDNSQAFWDNRTAASLGYKPEDSADDYADKVFAKTKQGDPNDPAVRFQGGSFAAAGHYEDEKK